MYIANALTSTRTRRLTDRRTYMYMQALWYTTHTHTHKAVVWRPGNQHHGCVSNKPIFLDNVIYMAGLNHSTRVFTLPLYIHVHVRTSHAKQTSKHIHCTYQCVCIRYMYTVHVYVYQSVCMHTCTSWPQIQAGSPETFFSLLFKQLLSISKTLPLQIGEERLSLLALCTHVWNQYCLVQNYRTTPLKRKTKQERQQIFTILHCTCTSEWANLMHSDNLYLHHVPYVKICLEQHISVQDKGH